ncbi:riboflavin kinase [Cardiobacterium valvarum F0432]|uniref:FAD synthase n=1 Tax=Cardiobacterium valvarum F0432 TaxID=797473 RepID=G9ZBW8_9GAMM|nr:riboflavin kinase [Cardiobacterium valvarum]EHM55944.1 riboflavin kinase [Cardiobacterium valvarum F0432]
MLIHRWQRHPALPHPVALAIGNFDGVHRGHQAILHTLAAEAAADNLTTALLSFFPHPKSLVSAEPPALLTPLRDRAHWLAQCGLEHWLLLSYTRPDAQGAGRLYPRVFAAAAAAFFAGGRRFPLRLSRAR